MNALWYCHNVIKVVHRDIKPENILLDQENTIKLCDFGVSEMYKGEDATLSGNKGTDYYNSPEECVSKLSYCGKKADIWSCGVTLYYLVFNKLPFSGQLNDCKACITNLWNQIENEEPCYDQSKIVMRDCKDKDSLVDLLK